MLVCEEERSVFRRSPHYKKNTKQDFCDLKDLKIFSKYQICSLRFDNRLLWISSMSILTKLSIVSIILILLLISIFDKHRHVKFGKTRFTVAHPRLDKQARRPGNFSHRLTPYSSGSIPNDWNLNAMNWKNSSENLVPQKKLSESCRSQTKLAILDFFFAWDTYAPFYYLCTI